MAIKLTLTEKQAKVVSTACEFYARIKIGQFKEIIWQTLDMQLPTDNFCERRDLAETNLLVARKFIYPELHGVGHSYGIGKFEEADKSFDVYQVLRQKFGDSRTPFSYYPVPICEKEWKEKENVEFRLFLTDEQAKIVAKACEFFARMKIGQFTRVIDITLDKNIPAEEYSERRNKAEEFLLEARNYIYPELGKSAGSSYAVRNFEDSSDAYDVHQVIEHFLNNSYSIFSLNSLPKCERVEGDEKEKKANNKEK